MAEFNEGDPVRYTGGHFWSTPGFVGNEGVVIKVRESGNVRVLWDNDGPGGQNSSTVYPQSIEKV